MWLQAVALTTNLKVSQSHRIHTCACVSGSNHFPIPSNTAQFFCRWVWAKEQNWHVPLITLTGRWATPVSSLPMLHWYLTLNYYGLSCCQRLVSQALEQHAKNKLIILHNSPLVVPSNVLVMIVIIGFKIVWQRPAAYEMSAYWLG